MYELHQVGERSYYIQSPAKIGLIRLSGTDVCLIDSGNDKDAGKKVLKLLNANGWRLTAIYNTHSNADHIGGNAYLQKQTGCKIYAPGIECAFTRFPHLEPSFLYGGFPLKELRHKFLMAQESDVLELTDDVLPEGMSLIRLPGHFFDMAGFRTADDVVYLADCLSSRETLDKYQIGFLYDVKAYLETLEKVIDMQAAVFIPAHAEPAANLKELARYNIDKVHETAQKILTLCRTPISFETLLKRLFDEYGLSMNFEQYVLVGSTVRSYLAYLADTGSLQAHFIENELLWNSLESHVQEKGIAGPLAGKRSSC
ncbi:MAG: MBL fold metallo-hydrolase [Lachnospiraceae bacterium]|jgi:glyoxylase-like metal-dependent hydrolase (beta-lactamase superfamily II)|nr:MBL fold metallo-hydrolase [Lachnospiraceae bacterium]